MIAARSLNLFVTSISTFLLALISSRYLGFFSGFGIAMIHATLLIPIYPYAYPHWLAEVFALLGIYFLTKNPLSRRYTLLTGVCFGLCILTIQSLGIPILIACLGIILGVGILERHLREAWLKIIWILGGCTIVIFPWVVYFYAMNALGPMFYGMFEWVFRHYPEGQKDAIQLGIGAYLDLFIAMHRSWVEPWRSVSVLGLKFSSIMPMLSIIGAAIALIQVSISRRKILDHGLLIMGLVSLAGTSPLLLGVTRIDIVHISFLGSLGLCGATVALRPLLNWKRSLRQVVSLGLILLGVVFLINYIFKAAITYHPSRELGSWQQVILKIGNVASWINSNVEPDERIVTAQGGMVYLFIRHAAIGYTFLPIDTPKYYSEQQWEDIGNQIVKNLPAVIEVTENQWQEIVKRAPTLNKIYKIIATGEEKVKIFQEEKGEIKEYEKGRKRFLLRRSISRDES